MATQHGTAEVTFEFTGSASPDVVKHFGVVRAGGQYSVPWEVIAPTPYVPGALVQATVAVPWLDIAVTAEIQAFAMDAGGHGSTLREATQLIDPADPAPARPGVITVVGVAYIPAAPAP